MLTEECLTQAGELFKKAQYQKCHRFILKCLSECEQNYRAVENNVSCDDFCQKFSENGGSNIVSSCSAVYKCIFQQNNEVCVFLCKNNCKKSSDDEVKSACEKYSRLLQDMHGWAISEHHLEVELIILHNYLATLLGHSVLEVKQWSENAFILISTALNRAFEVRTGSITSVHSSFTEEVALLIDGILMYAESMTELALTSLSAVCYSAFYLFAINNISFPVHCIKKIMSKIELACKMKKQKCQKPGFVCLYPSNLVTPGVPSCDDSLQLLLACSYMMVNDFWAAYSSLERVTYLGWEHFVGYMKAFLLFKERQYDQAFDISWPLWKTKQKTEDWMVSKICNFIGCCLFKKGYFSMSIKWFQKAVNSEFSHLSLWNMASAFKCLGRNDSSLEILKILEKASSVSPEPQVTHLCCNYLWLENQPEISHMQALYLLAHQSLSFSQYSLSTKYFTRILHILKEKPLEDLTYNIHFSISSLDIYIEASYAYLHARMYEDCLKTIDSAAHYFPGVNFMNQYESSSNWNVDVKKMPVPFGFNHCRKKTLSPTKFGGLSLFPLNSHSVHFGQKDVEVCEPILMRKENDKNSLKLNNSFVKDVDRKKHNCFRPNRIIHLMIEASAKYSLNCASEAVDILRRALAATPHYQEIQNNVGTIISKKQDDSAAKFSKECCSACSDLISSLMSQIYNNLAVIAISKNCLKEAAHNLRVAVMHDSSNIDAIYNYCVLQIQLEQVDVASSYWEASKHRCDRITSILASGNCNSSCTVTTDLLKSLNEILSFEG